VFAGNWFVNAVVANVLSVCVLFVRPPSVVQVMLSVVSAAAVPVGNVGIEAVTSSGVLPVLSKQKFVFTAAPPGTSGVAVVKPGVAVVLPVGQVVPAPMAKDAVDVVRLFGVSATVFDVRLANVIPPAKAATAPIVPTARTIGFIVRSFSIVVPPSTLLDGTNCTYAAGAMRYKFLP